MSSRSLHEDEDDEEGLIWAALERLPTYDRLRKGILGGSKYEVNVHNMGLQEKKTLLDDLLDNGDDNEKLLLKLKDRFERVGIDIPKIEVRFEHLNVEAEAYVGSRALPTISNCFFNLLEGLLSSAGLHSSSKKHLTILHDVSGIIKPGRMTLLLGPPGSGKTTLLLALAGKLDPRLQVYGRVSYNGHELHEFVPQRTAAYISQHDVHLAELTVRETLAFSARCQGVGSRYEMLAELSRREKAAKIKPDLDLDIFMKAVAAQGQKENMMTDYVLKILGLETCADTLVGNEMMRGISGGQKKRLTAGELLVGPAQAFFMDEISTGLDSSTTFQIMKTICNFVHILDGTVFVSLLQPEPETYDLFDDIILLSDSQIVYQGPRDTVLEFFNSMGFKCPERKGVADFLLEVTSEKDQHQYWDRTDDPHHFVSAKEFATAFESFLVGSEVIKDIVIPFDRSKSHPAALTKGKYGVNSKELLKACISREYLLMKRNYFVYISKLSELLVMGFIAMTTFFRTKMHKDSITNGTVFMGAFAYTVTRMMLNEFPEISLTVSKLPIFYKQRNLLFFPAWAYALPVSTLKIPINVLGVGILVSTAYYVTGYDPNVGRLFKQFLLLLSVTQMASGFFRFIGAVMRNSVTGYGIGAFTLLYLSLFGGFALSKENIRKWMVWSYWISPSMYAQNGICVNEFLGTSWSRVSPNTTERLGIAVLKSRGLFPHAYWYWLSVGVLLGFTVLFNVLYALALTFLNPLAKAHAIILEDSQQECDKEMENKLKRNTTSINSSVKACAISTEANHKTKWGMILPFERHCITFDEIRYSVDMPQEMKTQGASENKLELLRGLSGAFRPGILVALMGVSGAGKTTLLDVLAGRKTVGYIEGDIKISGYPKTQKTFARISGYCEQNDIHSPHITVNESLLFSAWLRLSPDVKRQTRMMFIEEVMDLVELTTLREALVGSPGETGLSIEQRKRLTIAVELVANPSVMFMDEPTSGLDARSAAIVMRTVRNTVDTGRAVVCTIHQPSIDIFEAFDELILLKHGGQQIYAGPLGNHSCRMIKYFESIEGVHKIKDGCNPATWMLEVTSQAQELSLGVDFAEIYRSSDLYRRNKALVQDLSIPQQGSAELYFPTENSQSFLVQLVACLWKQYWSYWRNPPYNASRFLFTLVTALVTGTAFWDIGSGMRTVSDLFSAIGAMFCAVFFVSLPNSAAAMPVVAGERRVFYRERAAGMYSAAPYALAQVIIEIPYVLIQSILFVSITYAMMGLEWTAPKFLWSQFFFFFTFLSFTYYGMVSVALTPNEHIAIISGSFLYAVWNLFAGYLIPRPRIPVWWRWCFWICPASYSLYGLAASQFGDDELTLEEGLTAQQYLREYFGYQRDFVWVAAAVVVVFPVIFAVTFAMAIKVLKFQQR